MEAILDHQGAGHNRRYLIKWKDSDDHTWLPTINLKGAQELLKKYTQETLKTTQKELPPTTETPTTTTQLMPETSWTRSYDPHDLKFTTQTWPTPFPGKPFPPDVLNKDDTDTEIEVLIGDEE